MDNRKIEYRSSKIAKLRRSIGSDDVLEDFAKRQLVWQSFYRSHETFMNTLRWIHARVKTPIIEETEAEVKRFLSTPSSFDPILKKSHSFSSPRIAKPVAIHQTDSSEAPLRRVKKSKRRLRSVDTKSEREPLFSNHAAEGKPKSDNQDNGPHLKEIEFDLICHPGTPREEKISLPDCHTLAAPSFQPKKSNFTYSFILHNTAQPVKQPRRESSLKDHQSGTTQWNKQFDHHLQFPQTLPHLDVYSEPSSVKKNYVTKKLSVKLPPIQSNKVHSVWK